MEQQSSFKRRIAGLMLAFFTLCCLLTLRLGWLQLVRGQELASLAANYHSRTIFYRWGHGSEGRGTIYDRNLQPLTEVKRQPGLAVFTTIGQGYTDFEDWLGTLTSLTGLNREEILLRSSLRRPLALLAPLPDNQDLPHWIVPVSGDWDHYGRFIRYSYKDLACHVLGFVSRPYVDEVAPGLLVGRLGIEKAFDDLLRSGRPGVSAMVDADNNLIAGLGYRSAYSPSGQPNVVLSLDLSVQQMVEEVFDRYIKDQLVPPSGAIVVMDPNTGDILAMVSRPAIDGSDYHHNRATRKSDNVAMLPLASVVKVLTAAAALEQNPDLLWSQHECTGTLTLGGNKFSCNFGPHGNQNMSEALANSCNIYFAQLAIEVGGQNLLNMAAAMGLGTKPMIGLLPDEVGAGTLPDMMDLATGAGQANHFAMGGNKLEVTPLQVAVMISSIANGGYRVEPRLVLSVNHQEGQRLSTPAVQRERIMRATTAQLVARMMRMAVIDGSASSFDHGSYPFASMELAAKTGTSNDNLPPRGYQVRWNAGFFPWQNPQYVVVYMAEVPPGPARVRREQIVAEIAQRLAQSTR
jgi:peptidoglycan glycosyltransferase/penicillin-binding protein 2